VNDHITNERIYHATAKLQALADGVHSSLLTRATGSAYVSINEDSCHRSSAYLDDDLSPQQVYFRTYCRNLPPESPPSLSPTPPPERALSPSRLVFQQGARIAVESHTKKRWTWRTSKSGRVAKAGFRCHGMVTRSRARPNERFFRLIETSGRLEGLARSEHSRTRSADSPQP
jgi:hypothetical protein